MSSIDINIKSSSYSQGHTYRHCYNGYSILNRHTLQCTRPFTTPSLIPITEVDSLLSARDIHTMRYVNPTLDKRELFNDIIENCEEFASDKNVVYDHKTGLDKYEYTVPIIEHLNLNKIPCVEDIYKPQSCPKKIFSKPVQNNQSKNNKKRSWKYYEAKKQNRIEAQYVVIDGNRYNSNYIYKHSAIGFVPVVMHPVKQIEYDIDESILRSKTFTSKTSVTVNFAKDSKVNGIVLNPEPMKLEYVYSDTYRGRHNSNYIRVMVNNPNYIQKFELYYRSSNTDGQWVKYGIFDGNSSIFDSIKIKFDEIVAKEIRIVPITHTGSFEKVSVSPLTYMEKRYDADEDDSVTYTIYLPHDKFRQKYSHEMGGRQSICGCHRCKGVVKGNMKERCREFVYQCSDI